MAGTELASAYISLFPKLKTNEIEAQLKGIKADGAGTTAGTSFGESFKKAFKAIAGAWVVKEFAQSLVSLSKTALDSYASFEQLRGGVEKIFDQMDNTQILEDAANAYKDLNMSANEYLEAINSTGAAFAATMGDEVGYTTARKGMKAIADYASGTGASIELLNEKFALISRSTSSYQSICDQFSGLLPQTNADFLAQAQAAGILSDQYTSLTEVPVAEYQQAIAEMLELGVEKAGLAGNTLAETEKTISGSLAALGASWSNWLTGLADDTADVGKLTDQLIESLVTAAKNIAPRILQILGSLGEALKTKLPELLDQLVASISSGGVGAGSAAVEFFGSILAALVKATPQILQALLLLLASLVVAIVNKAIEMGKAGIEMIKGLAQGVADGFWYVLDEIGRGIDEGIQRIKDKVEGFIQAGKDLIAGLVQGIKTAPVNAAGAIGDVASDMLAKATSVFQINSPSKAFMEIGQYAMEGLTLGVKNRASDAIGAVGSVARGALGAASFSATPQLATAGAGVGGTTYNIYIDGAQVNSDSAMEGKFYDLMVELKRYAKMEGGE